MARKRTATNLHQLTVKQVQNACESDLSDGGGLLLRVRGESSSWVFRYTAATGKRREMGLRMARLRALQQSLDEHGAAWPARVDQLAAAALALNTSSPSTDIGVRTHKLREQCVAELRSLERAGMALLPPPRNQ